LDSPIGARKAVAALTQKPYQALASLFPKPDQAVGFTRLPVEEPSAYSNRHGVMSEWI